MTPPVQPRRRLVRGAARCAYSQGARLALVLLLSVGALVGTSCSRASREAGAPPGKKPTRPLPGSDVILGVGDRTIVGRMGVTVESTRASAGPLEFVADKKPRRGYEWLLVGALVENLSSGETIDFESFEFRVSGAGDPGFTSPSSVVIATDRSRGLVSSAAIRPGGKAAMSLAFAVRRGDRRVLLTLRLADGTGGAQYLLR